ALKGDPSIPEATVEKILRAARDLNYEQNPLVASLMSTLRARKQPRYGPVIAYLTASEKRLDWKHNRTFERYHLGARDRARELGCELEHFWIREPGMSGGRLDQIFMARGIRGIVIAPCPTDTVIHLD